ncbi:MAG: hypothetical protein PHX60_04060 [Giesbergeria sp.]|uniref:hypothetical protein n=1 Tax=Giesbergeria sp. TaxID=2818473 RepID=UPI002628A631|nr:hypothetical protein [Giesbergeria sp.]MDD2608855.1 hypothetical protein [Giesbergeria sp.]
MLLFRWLVILLLMVAAVCFAFYIGTGRAYYKRLGFIVLKWTTIAATLFFTVLIAERVF